MISLFWCRALGKSSICFNFCTAAIFAVVLIEGNLEVKLPTIWTDGKAEVGRVRSEKESDEIRGRPYLSYMLYIWVNYNELTTSEPWKS